MLWGDIDLKIDLIGIEYFEFNERVIKIWNGIGDIRLFFLKMFFI